MQVVNKKNAMIFELVIENFKGVEVFAYQFEKGKPLVVYGDNGAGKTGVILSLYAALDKKKIPIKYDSLVGPYSIEGIKKAKIKLGIEGDSGILELNGKTLEKFYVNFSITEKGSVNLTLTDAISGEVDKSPSKEKIKNLLGLFIDPVDLVGTLDEPHGDRNLAEKLAAMVGLDLKPYVTREDDLFKEKQEENVTLKILQGKFADLDEPQEDWAIKYIDPASISTELQKLNEFNTKEDEKKRNIETFNNELSLIADRNLEIANEIESVADVITSVKKDYNLKSDKLVDDLKTFENFKENNKPDGWVDSQSIVDIEDQIKKLTEKAQLYRKYDHDISEGSKSIEIDTEKLSLSKKSLSEKTESYDLKKLDKKGHDKIVEEKLSKKSNIIEENKPIEWTGEKDPENIKTPLQYLTDKMSSVEEDNKQVNDRKNHRESEEGIELVKQSIKDIDDKRDQNTNEKLDRISSVDFPMDGITVDENTVWYDSSDGRGKQTILDRSEGERMRVCTHILIAGNTGPLNVIVVRQGHALSPKSQEIVFEVAAEYGYTVILETIISEKPGSVMIEAGNVKSVIPQKTVSENKMEEEKTETLVDDTIDW